MIVTRGYLLGVVRPFASYFCEAPDQGELWSPAKTTHLTRELELKLIQPHMAQKPVLRGEVGCACVVREVSVERGGMGERTHTHTRIGSKVPV